MSNVTGQSLKSEVLVLAEKIVELCHEHTSSEVVAVAATSIAGKVISTASLRLSEEHSLSAEALAQ
jgi:hypothetical protein